MNQTTHDYWSLPSTLSWNGRNHIAVSARSYQCLRPHNLSKVIFSLRIINLKLENARLAEELKIWKVHA